MFSWRFFPKPEQQAIASSEFRRPCDTRTKTEFHSFCSFAYWCVTAGAQVVGGSINGVVHDKTGAALQGVTITVRQFETGATRTLITDGDGRFSAPSLPVGNYTVSAKSEGFATDERGGISLAVAQSLQLNFVLGLASVQQQVEVDSVPRERQYVDAADIGADR